MMHSIPNRPWQYFFRNSDKNDVRFSALESNGHLGMRVLARCDISRAFYLAKKAHDMCEITEIHVIKKLNENNSLLEFYLSRLDDLIHFSESPVECASLYVEHVKLEMKKSRIRSLGSSEIFRTHLNNLE